ASSFRCHPPSDSPDSLPISRAISSQWLCGCTQSLCPCDDSSLSFIQIPCPWAVFHIPWYKESLFFSDQETKRLHSVVPLLFICSLRPGQLLLSSAASDRCTHSFYNG